MEFMRTKGQLKPIRPQESQVGEEERIVTGVTIQKKGKTKEVASVILKNPKESSDAHRICVFKIFASIY